MAEIESSITEERSLARTLLDLREAYTRARMKLPGSSLPELLMLAGAVEQAKTEGMRTKTGQKALATTSQVTRPASHTMMVSTGGKKPIYIVAAVSKLLEKSPLSIKETIATFEKLGWKIKTSSNDPSRTIRQLLERHKETFERVESATGGVRYKLKGAQKATGKSAPKVKSTGKKHLVKKATGRIIRALYEHNGKPLLSVDLAKMAGLASGQGLSPLLRSMRKEGAIKRVSVGKDGKDSLWDPVKEKLREYDAKHGGFAFSKGPAQLNGAGSHP
jgi:hypothetical protein